MPEITLVSATANKPMIPAILNSAPKITTNNRPKNVLTIDVVAMLKAPKRQKQTRSNQTTTTAQRVAMNVLPQLSVSISPL